MKTEQSDKPEPKPEASPPSDNSFWAELKRRKVMRVAITYAVMAWLIIQVASSTFGWFDIPKWAFQFVVIMLLTFFPVAILLAWAFELTPEGIKTAKAAQKEASESPDSARAQSKRTWMKIGFAAAAPTVIFGALAAFFYLQTRTSSSESEEPEKSIAVLPLINMSPDPDNAFFADGVHEDVLTNLSKIQELLVISRTSTLGYRNTTKKLKEIGQELSVRYLVEGSVRRAGNQVRVTVQLIDSQTDEHLWAENYDRSLDDIFAIQSEIAKRIADQLHAVISPEEIKRIEYRPTENLEAYSFWMKHHQLTELPVFRWNEKIELLEKAVSLDPKFAEAWAHLAIEYVNKWDYVEKRNSPELLAKVHHAVNRAKELRPDTPYIPYAQASISLHVDQDLDASIARLLEALTKDPSFSGAQRLLGDRYRALGRLAEAQHHYEAVHRANPLSQRTSNRLWLTYRDRKLWDQARSLIQKQIDLGDNLEAWQKRLVDITYLQYGDRRGYLEDLQDLPGFEENQSLLVWHAIISRDFATAQERLKRQNKRTGGVSILSRPVTLGLLAFVNSDQSLRAFARNRVEAHQAILETNVDVGPDLFSDFAIYQAFLGEREAVKEAISKTRELTSLPYHKYNRGATSEVKIAMAYLVLGDDQKAIETLESASKMPSRTPLNRELDLWFIFDQLRGNPRFGKLLED